MLSTVKKYVPYAVVILLVYMLSPLFFVFTGAAYQDFTPVLYDIVFPLTAIISSLIYGGKYGIDFFFSLVAPIIYIPSMLIYNGISAGNIIFVAIYLVSSIFGLFLGDMFFSKKRNMPEPELDVDLDIEEYEGDRHRKPTADNGNKNNSNKKPLSEDNDDFFDNYSVGDYKKSSTNAEDEIDKILNEIHGKK